MSKDDIESFRRALVTLRNRLTGDVSHLADEALRKNPEDSGAKPSGMPIHMADIGSDNFEQEFTLNLLASEELVLAEIAGALERVEAGTFGRCEECREAIPKARLRALPYTAYCVACARKLEQGS